MLQYFQPKHRRSSSILAVCTSSTGAGTCEMQAYSSSNRHGCCRAASALLRAKGPMPAPAPLQQTHKEPVPLAQGHVTLWSTRTHRHGRSLKQLGADRRLLGLQPGSFRRALCQSPGCVQAAVQGVVLLGSPGGHAGELLPTPSARPQLGPSPVPAQGQPPCRAQCSPRDPSSATGCHFIKFWGFGHCVCIHVGWVHCFQVFDVTLRVGEKQSRSPCCWSVSACARREPSEQLVASPCSDGRLGSLPRYISWPDAGAAPSPDLASFGSWHPVTTLLRALLCC